MSRIWIQLTIDRVSVLFRTDLAGKPPLETERASPVDIIRGYPEVLIAGIHYSMSAVLLACLLAWIIGSKGKVQQIGGEAQARLGDVRQDLKDSLRRVRDSLNRTADEQPAPFSSQCSKCKHERPQDGYP
jgi:hypothetical protein